MKGLLVLYKKVCKLDVTRKKKNVRADLLHGSTECCVVKMGSRAQNPLCCLDVHLFSRFLLVSVSVSDGLVLVLVLVLWVERPPPPVVNA